MADDTESSSKLNPMEKMRIRLAAEGYQSFENAEGDTDTDNENKDGTAFTCTSASASFGFLHIFIRIFPLSNNSFLFFLWFRL